MSLSKEEIVKVFLSWGQSFIKTCSLSADSLHQHITCVELDSKIIQQQKNTETD
jgi:hypothetical protein